MKTLDGFHQAAIVVALKKMFAPSAWVDICVIKEALQLANVHPNAQDMQALRLLHCVHWDTMPPAMVEETQRRILALFTTPQYGLQDWEDEIFPERQEAKPRSWRTRLLGA